MPRHRDTGSARTTVIIIVAALIAVAAVAAGGVIVLRGDGTDELSFDTPAERDAHFLCTGLDRLDLSSPINDVGLPGSLGSTARLYAGTAARYTDADYVAFEVTEDIEELILHFRYDDLEQPLDELRSACAELFDGLDTAAETDVDERVTYACDTARTADPYDPERHDGLSSAEFWRDNAMANAAISTGEIEPYADFATIGEELMHAQQVHDFDAHNELRADLIAECDRLNGNDESAVVRPGRPYDRTPS